MNHKRQSKAETRLLGFKLKQYIHDQDNDPNIYCFGSGGGQSGGGGGGDTTTTQKSEPWDKQKPYLTTGFARAESDVLNANPNYFPGSTVIPYSDQTQQALNLIESRAVNGSPVMNSANEQLLSTLQGDFVPQDASYDSTMGGILDQDFNYDDAGFDARFNDVMGAAYNKINPMIDSQFAAAGRTGAGLADAAKMEALGNVFANQYFNQYNTDKGLEASIYGQNQQIGAANYDASFNRDLNALQNERTNQMRSIMFAPQAANQDYTDAAQLGQVGAQYETLDQQYLADEVDRYNYEQTVGQQQLANYMDLIQGNYGGTTLTNGTQAGSSPNRFLTGIGGAAAGAGIGSAIGEGYGGWGAGLGLLGGMLF